MRSILVVRSRKLKFLVEVDPGYRGNAMQFVRAQHFGGTCAFHDLPDGDSRANGLFAKRLRLTAGGLVELDQSAMRAKVEADQVAHNASFFADFKRGLSNELH